MRDDWVNLEGRMAQVRPERVGVDFWRDRWTRQDLESYLDSYRDGRLDEYEHTFLTHLSRSGPILEAGCGLGQIVVALAARGYDVEGLDYVEETIQSASTIRPDLRFRRGDVLDIDVEDGHYSGYISIGVVEHTIDGPGRALREARRVLHPEGRAFISVPYLNRERNRSLRRLDRIGRSQLSESVSFYQYYFSIEDFSHELESAGLEVVDLLPYATFAGLTRDGALGRALQARNFYAWPVQRRFHSWCAGAPGWARRRWAHMMMYVCRPTTSTTVET